MFFQCVVEQESSKLRAWSKVEDQSYLKKSGSQIVQKLRFVGGVYPGTSFSLHQYPFFNHQIRPESSDNLTSETDG
jgi:hypothetical protein